jgi:hypothetical protein
MKIYLLSLLFTLIAWGAIAQTDFTGIYSYSFPIDRELTNIKPGKEDGGPSAELIVAKMEGDQYHFWLNISRGWPSYNNGFISGSVVLIKGKGTYIQQDPYGDGNCVLHFTFKPLLIEIVSEGYEHCGFGHNVYADGSFKKSKKILTSEYLFASMEGMGTVQEIKTEKAIIYKDSNLLIPTKQYFIKKDKVYTSELSNKGIRITYIAKGQKYVYGWIRKEDL